MKSWRANSASPSPWRADTETYSIDALRAFGERRVQVKTSDGMTLDGRLVQNMLHEESVVVLLAPEDAVDEPVVIPLESIAAVEER